MVISIDFNIEILPSPIQAGCLPRLVQQDLGHIFGLLACCKGEKPHGTTPLAPRAMEYQQKILDHFRTALPDTTDLTEGQVRGCHVSRCPRRYGFQMIISDHADTQ